MDDVKYSIDDIATISCFLHSLDSLVEADVFSYRFDGVDSVIIESNNIPSGTHKAIIVTLLEITKVSMGPEKLADHYAACLLDHVYK